ncbi:MAG: MotA/TolQ/ExbB proton channel family protein [Pseudomonadota bacterium]
MLELVEAGGWLMLPIIACSIVALAIIVERIWSLQVRKVLPRNLVAQVWRWEKINQLNAQHLQELQSSSPLGSILAAGIANRNQSRNVMKDSIEDTGRHVVHELEYYLNSLGTIAAITPLLGLLGTVIGMIKVFATITTQGVGNPGALAGGISEALLTTAAGMSVAIPTLMFYRYFRGRVRMLVVRMEQEALRMVEVMHAGREQDS